MVKIHSFYGQNICSVPSLCKECFVMRHNLEHSNEGRLKVILLLQASSHDFELTFIIIGSDL